MHNTKHSFVSTIAVILTTLAIGIALSGCKDDFIKPGEMTDGEVELLGEVMFRPLVPTEIKTRTNAPDGAKYKGIRTLHIFFFDSDKNIVKKYSGEVDFTPTPSNGSTHEHVTFKKRVQAGEYYVYAVANISEAQKNSVMDVETVDELRNFKLVWDDLIDNDTEMFGVFRQDYAENATVPDNESFEDDVLLAIAPTDNSIYSWVRRAASKVTVDFDGTNLMEDCMVYIKKATLKDVSDGALLGASSWVGMNDFACGASAYSINYGNGDSFSNWLLVTKENMPSPSDVWNGTSLSGFHDDKAMALPCYENMQGEPEGKSKLQDSDGDGIIDSDTKDGVENGTYLEVEGYYVSNRTEYKSQGKIIYRFMLGKDALKNFDLVRNHHYKITMQFKGYGNDVDWHIEYADKYLDVTYPVDVNYQGKFFIPDDDYSNLPNAGHKFGDENTITVTSYETDGKKKEWKNPEISYTYYSYDDKTGGWLLDNNSTDWLTYTVSDIAGNDTQKLYTFKAAMTNPTDTTINELFPSTGLGDENKPYNLSNEEGTLSEPKGKKTDIENTANCYIVGAPGWYCFPLVYGNAISDKEENKDAYKSTHLVNHLGNHISDPYITDNTGITLTNSASEKLDNITVKLIWQDAKGLIVPGDIVFDPELFEKKGGIKFHIGKIQEGNAVIALIDTNAGEDEYVNINRGTPYGTSGSTKAIWSWHIWATRFGSDDFEKNISILNHNENSYDIMPVNLGWCSDDKPIRYYRRRKCDIKFKFGENEIIRTIVQHPHFALPKGNHTYYQWGRKDPFVGTNGPEENKTRWTHDGTEYGTGSQYNPPRLYNEPENRYKEDKRHKTTDCQNVLIKNPDKWHNAPRTPVDEDDLEHKRGFVSANENYDDLWSNAGKKTVYDPCPPGYQVGYWNVFSGFTTTGTDEGSGIKWNDVLESNMLSDFYGSDMNNQVLELYTDTRKIQSITFPVTGYRDYDSRAAIFEYANPEKNTKGVGLVWSSSVKDKTNSYYLRLQRNDLQQSDDWKQRRGEISPSMYFFNNDGFAVRPVGCSKE